MSTDTVQRSDPSLFARLVGRQRPGWITLVIGILLVLLPIGAAQLDGALGDLFSQSEWRFLFLPSVVILYILIVAPILRGRENDVIEAFRSLVLLDEESFHRVVDEASRINPIGEGIAFGAGTVLGLWIGRIATADSEGFWLNLYIPVFLGLMFGLLGWTIYIAVAGTRLTAALHRQPLRIDIFDPDAFKPVGRQSLVGALAFVGGILLGMIFGLGPTNILEWQNWVLIAILALVPVLVFFLTMRDTHRVLAAQKDKELSIVQRNIRDAGRTMMERIEAGEEVGALSAKLSALIAYEDRLQAARTWPYDTAMLRTLVVSVLVPGGAALVRAAAVLMGD
jgi:hypothetical protein